MRRRIWAGLAGTSVVLLGLTLLGAPAEGAGPWRAQIVDVGTGQPLQGVVVLAYWFRYTASPAGWAGGEFYAANEVVTGPDGRFEIPSRIAFNWLPVLTKIKGPEFIIFKPGYGYWQMRKPPRDLKWEGGECCLPDELFQQEGVVIALPQLRTREERSKYYGGGGYRTPPGGVPAESQKLFREAEEQERAYLGLTTIQRSRP